MHNKAELGDDMYLFYFIFMLIVITIGVVVGSLSAFGKPYDSRKVDSEAMMSVIQNCIATASSLSEKSLQDIPALCGIDTKTMESGIVVSVSINGNQLYKYGDIVSCGLQDKYANAPRCSSSSVKVNVDNTIQDVYITTGSTIK